MLYFLYLVSCAKYLLKSYIPSENGNNIGIIDRKLGVVQDYGKVALLYLNTMDNTNFNITLVPARDFEFKGELEIKIDSNNNAVANEIEIVDKNSVVYPFQIMYNWFFNTKMIKSGSNCLELIKNQVKSVNECDFQNKKQQFYIDKI
ncbi:hypothetical protein EHP00_1159 [Ecytonucleospora hepatopenaei]|uniref:Uncharacterized protein n=1 Tax=Ecytonucleospora hepatopenaei TaxID=646526 RepID=A0A1W0E4G5_9MICR|nr:hypothetical protein EHP00_1159 [Ecytonucleospora hepatopenaei]